MVVGVTWIHGCIGLFTWMRLKSWWPKAALIAYPDEEESVPVIASINHNSDEQLTANFTLSDNEKTASVSLGSIADDIVDNIVDHLLTQLLPDLEQQLRLLVHQALEDKLPGELPNKDTTDKAS